MATTLLPIHDAPKVIQFTQAILDFTMLAQYILHDRKTLRYMKHTLCKLEKTKITFEQYRLINSKLYQSTLNYPRFYTISHFDWCIQDYGSTVNHDTFHSKAAYE